MGEKLYTVAEVAQEIGMKPGRLYNWVRSGRVPSLVGPSGRLQITASTMDELRYWAKDELPDNPTLIQPASED